MSAQTESKITALYERLSRDDDLAGDSNSIILKVNIRKQKGRKVSIQAVFCTCFPAISFYLAHI